MTRRDLATMVVNVLNENGVKKPIPPQKAVFHISDDNGKKTDFVVKKDASSIRFTVDDVTTIIDALLKIVVELIKQGERVALTGFGALYLKRRAARTAPHPITGETMLMKEHYVVKFDCGKDLKTAAALYTINNDDMMKQADDILASGAYYDEDEDVIDDGDS